MSDILTERSGNILRIQLNRPARKNAMTVAMYNTMADLLNDAVKDDQIRVVLWHGAGDSFSAGMDLKEFFRDNDHLSPPERAHIYRTNAAWQWRQFQFYSKPTIAMVNGWCFGGAFTPLVSCDLAIAAEEATFGLSEINWGIIPAGVVTKAVSQVMSQRDCLYYIMTGETFDGRKAAAMNLVNEAVPLKDLRARTRKLAKTLMEKNPTVLRAAKHAYRRVRYMSWDDAEDYLMSKMDQVRFFDEEHGREKGLTQFLDEKSFKPGLAAYRRDR